MEKGLSLPKAITFGTKIQLKREACKDVIDREWEFSGIKKGKLVLSGREGYILEARPEDIDWNDF